MHISSYIRQHHLGLVAIFIALTGTAYAGNQAADQRGSEPKAVNSKKKKPGPRGPQGPQGPQGVAGAPGAPGQAGSPDTGTQILTKLAPVDGAGSGLNADELDGLSSVDYARMVLDGTFIVMPFVFVTGPPGSEECDSVDEGGRIWASGNGTAAAELYLCDTDVGGGLAGWVSID